MSMVQIMGMAILAAEVSGGHFLFGDPEGSAPPEEGGEQEEPVIQQAVQPQDG